MHRFVWTFLISYLNFASLKRLDVLSPYDGIFGGKIHYREVRDCFSRNSNGAPHKIVAVNATESKYHRVTVKSFVNTTIGKCAINGNVAFIANPLRDISVLQPKNGGCKENERSKVSETGEFCEVAVNAGLFDTKTGQCHGNVVSNGVNIQESGDAQNAHFGILKNNSVFVGYLPSMSQLNETNEDFQQIVGGVIWLVKDGKSFVNSSMELEYGETQESGSLSRFVNVKSARTSVGFDKNGRVIILQVNGWTDIYGVTLHEMADLMIGFGAVEAINLDGGGSSTFVANGTVVSKVSDECPDRRFHCERKVTTILCVNSSSKRQSHVKVNTSDNATGNKTNMKMVSYVKETESRKLARQNIGIMVSLAVFVFISLMANIAFIIHKLVAHKRNSKSSNNLSYSSIANVVIASSDEEDVYEY